MSLFDRLLGRRMLPLIDARIAEQAKDLTLAAPTHADPPAPIVAEPFQPPAPIVEQPFELRIHSIARALAATGERRVVLPLERTHGFGRDRRVRVGFVGNIANNAYNAVRCLRRMGIDAELVVEDGWFDRFVMNRPFWEDVDVRCAGYDDALTFEPKWRPASYVRRVSYDVDLQTRYQNRLSAIPEVQALYKDTFNQYLAPDRALLLAQVMGHWPVLVAMRRYDVVQFSGEATSMAVFCPRPHVVYPTGSDLYVSPFDETIFGLMMRAAYLGADQVLAGEPNYGAYLQRLGRRRWWAAPLMIDTDRYVPGEATEVRARWSASVGGTHYLLASARQAWMWKGNDVLIRGFAEFARRNGGWRLVLQEWGPDVARSRELIASLDLTSLVHWEPLCSKPVLRRHQQAADLCADQLVYDGGYGTSVLEAMAAGKPVLMRAPTAQQVAHLREPPPFIVASDVPSVVRGLSMMSDAAARQEASERHLAWVRAVHGFDALWSHYVGAYHRAITLEDAAPASAFTSPQR